jgi:NADH-quinone oxidoreductase subunit A
LFDAKRYIKTLAFGGQALHPLPETATLSPWVPNLLPLFIFFGMVLALVAVLLLLAQWIGERKITPEKQRPYECGIIPTGPARLHHPVPFYLVAIFFIIFDVEAVYILSWAAAYEALGWSGWLRISFFIIILLISLFYIWKKRGLDWGPRR